MRRDIFSDEHEMLREQFRRFVENEIEPKIDGWNRAGISDRESWKRCGTEGRRFKIKVWHPDFVKPKNNKKRKK